MTFGHGAVFCVDRGDGLGRRRLGELGLGLGGRLPHLGRAHTEAELARPADAALEDRLSRRCGGAHPRAGVVVFAAQPQLPRLTPGPAVVVDQQLSLGVDGVLATREGELEQLRLGDRLRRARLDAEVAVDAPQVVDLVHEAVTLARRHRRVGRVVGAAHVDALRRAHAGAQLAADALLHAVLVAIEDVTAVEPHRLRTLLVRVPLGHLGPPHLADGDPEPAQPAHYRISSRYSCCLGTEA